MAVEKIIIRRQISWGLLFVLWLLLLAIPAVFLDFSLAYLFKFSFERNCSAKKSWLVNEIELFRQKIDAEKFLQSKLIEFFHSRDFMAESLNAAEIARSFQKKSGIIPSAVFINDSELNDQVCFFVKEEFFNKIGFIGRSLTRKYMNSRQLQEKLFSDTEISGDELVSNRIRQQIDEADLFLMKQFSLVSPCPVMSGQVFSSVSARANDRLFFYYGSLPSVNTGIMMIFSGMDLDLKKILKESLISDSAFIQRSFALKKMIADDLVQPEAEKITEFVSNEKGIQLQAPLPQPFLSLLIQNSGFYPHRIEQFRQFLPILKVSIHSDQLQHPLKRWHGTIKSLSKSAVLAGLLFCFYFGLFGFSLKAGVRQKAVFGIAMIAWLPLAMMMASYLSWREISLVRYGFETDDRLSQIANDMALRFDSFLLKQQKMTRKIADKIEEIVNSDKDSLTGLINREISSTFAREAFYDVVDREGVYVKTGKALVNPEADRSENFMRHALAVSLLQAVSYKKQSKIEKFSNYEDQGLFRPNPEFINSLLNKKTRLFTFKSFNSNYAYTLEPVSSAKIGTVKSFICLRFEKDELIRQFIKTFESFEQDGIELNFVKYRENIGVFRYEPMRNFYSLSELQPILDLVLTTKRSRLVDLKNSRSLIFFIPDYPFLIICQSQKKIGENDRKMVFLVIFYMTFLVFVIFRLFGSLYVTPLMQLSQVARDVADGNYYSSASINTFDEFFQLNKTFDLMIKGVIQKEKLLQFVSSDVAQAVKSNDDSSLSPGGERVEATIAFITIAGIEQMLENTDSEKLLDILETFIAAGNKIAAQNNGVLDKVIENTLMLVFRGMANGQSDALRACTSVLQMQKLMAQENMPIQAGIASGFVVSGKIGSRSGKLDFTVIGDPVNLAARLKGQACKACQTGILISASVIRKARGMVKVNFIERVSLKGKTRKYQLYELVSLRVATNCEEKPC
ncbi:MAG: adenylate/guanylate cyclase domain-containing protein [Candidatus Rifleibacteriota bacterium]